MKLIERRNTIKYEPFGNKTENSWSDISSLKPREKGRFEYFNKG